MSVEPNVVIARPREAVVSTNKVLRNTYTLLSMTLIFSAVMAAVSVALRMPPMTYLVCVIGGMVLAMFVLPRFANSGAGVGLTFAVTGLLGFGIGPLVSMYLSVAGGPTIVATALAGTGVIFLGLSGYALMTRKDFSFMGGFLAVGMLVAILAIIANLFLAIPAMSLAISAVVIMLMSGFILYDTSRMIHDPNTNYIMMTVGLYINIFNIFVHLLHILGVMGGDD